MCWMVGLPQIILYTKSCGRLSDLDGLYAGIENQWRSHTFHLSVVMIMLHSIRDGTRSRRLGFLLGIHLPKYFFLLIFFNWNYINIQWILTHVSTLWIHPHYTLANLDKPVSKVCQYRGNADVVKKCDGQIRKHTLGHQSNSGGIANHTPLQSAVYHSGTMPFALLSSHQQSFCLSFITHPLRKPKCNHCRCISHLLFCIFRVIWTSCTVYPLLELVGSSVSIYLRFLFPNCHNTLKGHVRFASWPCQNRLWEMLLFLLNSNRFAELDTFL